jgi:hypothetical protein
MLRKYLFWGLTLLLIVALTNIIIRGCRLEKEQTKKLVETVEEAKPTATRVLNPQDLKIVQSKLVLETRDEGGKQSHTARHEIEIYNGGNVSYMKIQLRLDYLNRSGKKIETRTHAIVQTISPGATLKLPSIAIDNVPSSAADLQTTIVYADIATSTPPNQ